MNLWFSSAKIILNGQQMDQTYGNYYEEYQEPSSDIIPGVSTSGVIIFDAMDPAEFQLYIEGSSDDWELDFSPYVFDLAQ